MLENVHKKRGVMPQALKERPIIGAKILPYYRGWNLLDARRQVNEAGAQPFSLTEMTEAAKLVYSEDNDEIYEFCMVITIAEAAILKDMADERRRALDRLKLKNKHG